MTVGTFMVARTVWDHPEFARSSFSEREAFLWMVSEAAWKPRRKRVGKVVVDLERGQLAHSTRFLSDAWDWSHSKVRRFLERLENRHMIERQTDTGVSVICITNYDTYQLLAQPYGTVAARKAAQKRHSSGTNEKNLNKGNKEKKDADASARQILAEAASLEVAADFVQHRREIKSPLTERSARAMAKKLAGHGAPDRVLMQSIENGWRGIFPDKVSSAKAKPEPGATRTTPDGKMQTYHPFEGWMTTHA